MLNRSFETDRLFLRPTIEEDSAFILSLMNSPKWLKYIGDRGIKTDQEAKAYINEKIVAQQKRLGFSNYTVIRKSDQKKMGSCGLYDRPGLKGVDIGFAFLPEYERHGYGFEASVCILKAAKEIFGIREVKAICSKENIASQKLLEKLGLQFKKLITLPDDKEELMLYSIDFQT